MKYIITGHKGQIGLELKKLLDEMGECVLAIDQRDGDNISNMTLYQSTKADIFFHLADNCKINEMVNEPGLSFQNVEGVQECLEYCRLNGIKKFVYFSSSRVLSKEKNPYVAGKLYGEELCKAYKECYGIEYIIIRPSSVYGGIDETGRLHQIWTDNLKKGKDLIIYGDEKKTLSFTHIDDFVRAVIYTLDEWNEDYNIAGKEVNLYKLAKKMIKQTGSKSKIVFKEPETAQPQRVKVSTNKIRKLGWRPQHEI